MLSFSSSLKQREAGMPEIWHQFAEKVAIMRWSLARLYGREVQHDPYVPELHLLFFPVSEDSPGQGKIVGSDGWMRFEGRYVFDDPKLRFYDMKATKILSSDGLEHASLYTRALNEAESGRISNGRLELFNHGQPIAVFEGSAL